MFIRLKEFYPYNGAFAVGKRTRREETREDRVLREVLHQAAGSMLDSKCTFVLDERTDAASHKVTIKVVTFHDGYVYVGDEIEVRREMYAKKWKQGIEVLWTKKIK